MIGQSWIQICVVLWQYHPSVGGGCGGGDSLFGAGT